MDSKLRRTAILSSMAVILLVSLLVFFTNSEEREDSRTGVQSTAQPTEDAGRGTAAPRSPRADRSAMICRLF